MTAVLTALAIFALVALTAIACHAIDQGDRRE